MARKINGNSIPRKRKTATTVEPALVQPVDGQTVPETSQNVMATDVATGLADFNLDEEIRRRAYELYLERNGADGDPNGDWFIAEREVRLRYAGANRPSALAAGQGRG